MLTQTDDIQHTTKYKTNRMAYVAFVTVLPDNPKYLVHKCIGQNDKPGYHSPNMKQKTDAHNAHNTPELGMIFDYIFTLVSSVKARKKRTSTRLDLIMVKLHQYIYNYTVFDGTPSTCILYQTEAYLNK